MDRRGLATSMRRPFRAIASYSASANKPWANLFRGSVRSNFAPPPSKAAECQMKVCDTGVEDLRRSLRRTILTIMAIALAAFTYSSLSSLPKLCAQR